MILREICQWVEDHSKDPVTFIPQFEIGTNLIYGHRLTESPVRCVLASETSVGESDFYLVDKVSKIVTFVARSNSYEEASQDIDDIFTLLHGSVGWDLPILSSGNAYHIQLIQSIGLPVYLGQDESDLYEFSCSFEFKIQRQ